MAQISEITQGCKYEIILEYNNLVVSRFTMVKNSSSILIAVKTDIYKHQIISQVPQQAQGRQKWELRRRGIAKAEQF